MKTAKEQDGLKGPVHTVRLSVTTIGQRDTSGYTTDTTEQDFTYTPDGRKLEEIRYGEDRTIRSRKVFIADESQHTGWTMFGSDGSLRERLVRVHDPNGERTEDFRYDTDGKLWLREVRDYDKDCRQCDYAHYTADGTFLWKHVTIFDDQERVIEERHYVYGKEHENRTVFSYSDSGNTIELASYNAFGLCSKTVIEENTKARTSETYDARGVLASRELIEWVIDDYGNWTEERVSTWGLRDIARLNRPTLTELHHRIITYY